MEIETSIFQILHLYLENAMSFLKLTRYSYISILIVLFKCWRKQWVLENQFPSYQKTIDLAKAEVQKIIESLAEKGVNIAEVEVQIKSTEDKIDNLN